MNATSKLKRKNDVSVIIEQALNGSNELIYEASVLDKIGFPLEELCDVVLPGVDV